MIQRWRNRLPWNHPLKFWHPTTRYLRWVYWIQPYRHSRRCGFHRWEATINTLAGMLGIWWTLERPLRRIYR